MLIELKDIKEHLLIQHDLDDYLLLSYEEAAADAVRLHLNVEDLDELRDDSGELPASVRQAILFLIGHFYANREVVTYGSATTLPYAFDYLIALNQVYYKNKNNKCCCE